MFHACLIMMSLLRISSKNINDYSNVSRGYTTNGHLHSGTTPQRQLIDIGLPLHQGGDTPQLHLSHSFILVPE